MDHYCYTSELKTLWQAAVDAYQSGNRDPGSYFNEQQLNFLKSIGLKTMDVYDYAEDFCDREEPDFETFLMICEARRDYFFTTQKGQPSDARLDPATLPPKDASLRGINWLPRIIPKAIAKLRGELPDEIMYNCGGDRRFFKANNIHPAEFLRVAWAYQDNIDKIIDWVQSRRPSEQS